MPFTVDVGCDTVNDRLPQALRVVRSRHHALALVVGTRNVHSIGTPEDVAFNAPCDLSLHRAIAVRASNVIEVEVFSVVRKVPFHDCSVRPRSPERAARSSCYVSLLP